MSSCELAGGCVGLGVKGNEWAPKMGNDGNECYFSGILKDLFIYRDDMGYDLDGDMMMMIIMDGKERYDPGVLQWFCVDIQTN